MNTIALIDWNWVGHHPTYFTKFSAAIARAGFGVAPFCGDPTDFSARLAELDLPSEVRGRIAEPVYVAGPKKSYLRPARWRRHHEALRCFFAVSKSLKRWQRAHGAKIDFLFFACIYDRHFEHFRLAQRFLPIPCSGLYLHARSFRMPGSPMPYFGGLPCPEKIFTVPSMQSICILDEGITDAVSKTVGGKPVHVFPDITNESLPTGNFPEGLGGKLKALAAGRPIVSLTGHLHWTKGIDIFTEVAAHPDLKDVLFFLGGDVMWRETSPEQRQKLEAMWEGLPNLLVHLRHLPEPSMNSVIAASDVMVAAYRQFPNSSNALTKAAVFQRPIIVSDGYLMAERVRNYQLGEVIPEGDVEALSAALKKMLQPDYYDKLRQRARWKDYARAHDAKRLDEVFREVLAEL